MGRYRQTVAWPDTDRQIGRYRQFWNLCMDTNGWMVKYTSGPTHNNNGHLAHPCNGPKRSHILLRKDIHMYIYYDSNSQTHAHRHWYTSAVWWHELTSCVSLVTLSPPSSSGASVLSALCAKRPPVIYIYIYNACTGQIQLTIVGYLGNSFPRTTLPRIKNKTKINRNNQQQQKN